MSKNKFTLPTIKTTQELNITEEAPTPAPKPEKKTRATKKKKIGRPPKKDKKPTVIQAIRVHPLIPKLVRVYAGVNQIGIGEAYNQLIYNAVKEYKKKAPEIFGHIEMPPEGEL